MALPALGAYELDQTLGRSALGITYAGQRRGVPIVIKVLELAADVSERQRQDATKEFRHRAEGISALFLPGMVPLRDYGVAPPFLYAVSGLVTAGSLIDPEGQRTFTPPLPAPQMLELVGQIAQTLQEAHRLGVAHGNLKPSNLFIAEERTREQPHLLVGDFLLLSTTQRAVVPAFGQRPVLRYLAPENYEAAPTPAGDQFALAAIAYEWLTGKTAFAEVPLANRTIITPVTELLPTLAPYPEIDGVFAQAFSRAPADRFNSIQTFAEALTRAFTRSRPNLAAQPIKIEDVPTNVPPDPNDTRPSHEMPILPPTIDAPVVPPQAAPAQATRDPSAFLLDAPIGPRPPTADLERMVHTEAAADRAGSSVGGKKRGRRNAEPGVPLARGPTTREQDLMAPPAPRSRPRARQRVSPRAPLRPMSPIQEEEGLPPLEALLPRREVLVTAGKLALVGGIGIAGLVIAAKTFNLGQLFHGQPSHNGHVPAPLVLVGHLGTVQTLAWSPDATRLASGAANDGAVRLWDVSRPQAPVALLATNAPQNGGVTDLSWARDSHYLMVSPVGAKTQIWNVGQQSIITQLPYTTQIAQWHPRQDVAALVETTAMGQTSQDVLLWDLTNAKLSATLTGHAAPLQTLAWSLVAGPLQLASGDAKGTIFAWSGASAATVAAVGNGRAEDSNAIASLAWATNTTRFLSGSADGSARLWSVNQNASLATWRQSATAVGAVTWLAGSTVVAIGLQNGTVVLWDSAARQVLLTLNASPKPIASLSWSANGRYLAAGAGDQQIYVWDTSQIG
jgi:serine/threonine protein kinase